MQVSSQALFEFTKCILSIRSQSRFCQLQSVNPPVPHIPGGEVNKKDQHLYTEPSLRSRKSKQMARGSWRRWWWWWQLVLYSSWIVLEMMITIPVILPIVTPTLTPLLPGHWSPGLPCPASIINISKPTII